MTNRPHEKVKPRTGESVQGFDSKTPTDQSEGLERMNSSDTPSSLEGPFAAQKKAAALTFEIASLANMADNLAFNFAGASGDFDATDHLIESLRETVQRIGWLADLASGQLGGVIAVGGAQDWMLPPTCTGKPSRHALMEAH